MHIRVCVRVPWFFWMYTYTYKMSKTWLNKTLPAYISLYLSIFNFLTSVLKSVWISIYRLWRTQTSCLWSPLVMRVVSTAMTWWPNRSVHSEGPAVSKNDEDASGQGATNKMLVVFSDIGWVVHCEFVPQDHAVYVWQSEASEGKHLMQTTWTAV